MAKTVIITGGSKGIGAATAISFAELGYNTVINYNNSFQNVKLLTSSLTSRGFSVMSYKADVRNRMETDLMVKETLYKFGSIDVLVNNAGIALNGLINRVDDIDVKNLLDTDLLGVYNCCRSVSDAMINQKSGKIINISSMWGVEGASCEVAYSAAKAGVIGLTKALAKELAPSGITVNAVAPGLIQTSMNNHLSTDELGAFVDEIPLGRMGTPEDVASAVTFLASEGADYITGEVINVNGGYVM